MISNTHKHLKAHKVMKLESFRRNLYFYLCFFHKIYQTSLIVPRRSKVETVKFNLLSSAATYTNEVRS